MHGGYGQMSGPGGPPGMMMGGPPRPSLSPAGPFGPNAGGGGGMQHPGGMQGMQQPGGMPRMMGPGSRAPGPNNGGGPFNGANVQVKASAPNTIQYLPARPQTSAPSPRGPPSLEFLQRFTGPMSGGAGGNNMDGNGGKGFFNSGGPQQQQMQMSGGPMMNMNGPKEGEGWENEKAFNDFKF